jgi:hypothetical protein
LGHVAGIESILGLLAELLQAGIDLLQFFGYTRDSLRAMFAPSFLLRFALGIVAIGAVYVAVRRLGRSGAIWRPLSWVARNALLPRDRPRSDDAASLYPQLIQDQLPLLLMSRTEFCRAAELWPWEAAYLILNPTSVPRHDVERRIRRALMVPSRWPSPPDYGPRLTVKRLRWYASKGQVAWTFLRQLEATTPTERATVLRLLESQIRDDLKRGHTS